MKALLMRVAVSIEDLSYLDALVWFGNGEDASSALNISQSTISRASRRVAKAFQLDLIKGEEEWILLGDRSCLDMQRHVHQRLRFALDKPLRLEAQYYSAPYFTSNLEGNYFLGKSNFLDIRKPLDLLRSSVLDAWIAGYPDIPSPGDLEFRTFHLTRLPLHLVVSARHPLVSKGASITLDDVINYPSIALKDGAFPESQKILEGMGLWNSPARVRRYDRHQWLGLTSDEISIAYASVFSIELYPQSMVMLPLDIGFQVGESLVVKREYAEHERIITLLRSLQKRAVELSTKYSEVSLAF